MEVEKAVKETSIYCQRYLLQLGRVIYEEIVRDSVQKNQRKNQGSQIGGGWYCLQYLREMVCSLGLQRHILDFSALFIVYFLTCESEKNCCLAVRPQFYLRLFSELMANIRFSFGENNIGHTVSSLPSRAEGMTIGCSFQGLGSILQSCFSTWQRWLFFSNLTSDYSSYWSSFQKLIEKN